MLSDPKTRLDFYIDGRWVEFVSIILVQTQGIKFNTGPLYIGFDNSFDGFSGQIRYQHNQIDRSRDLKRDIKLISYSIAIFVIITFVHLLRKY